MALELHSSVGAQNACWFTTAEYHLQGGSWEDIEREYRLLGTRADHICIHGEQKPNPGGALIAPHVYMLSTCPWRRDEFAVCESNGLDSGVV
jgi:hypothetical protein